MPSDLIYSGNQYVSVYNILNRFRFEERNTQKANNIAKHTQQDKKNYKRSYSETLLNVLLKYFLPYNVQNQMWRRRLEITPSQYTNWKIISKKYDFNEDLNIKKVKLNYKCGKTVNDAWYEINLILNLALDSAHFFYFTKVYNICDYKCIVFGMNMSWIGANKQSSCKSVCCVRLSRNVTS